MIGFKIVAATATIIGLVAAFAPRPAHADLIDSAAVLVAACEEMFRLAPNDPDARRLRTVGATVGGTIHGFCTCLTAGSIVQQTDGVPVDVRVNNEICLAHPELWKNIR